MKSDVTLIPPIRQEVVVGVSREKAFDVFTSRMAEWWIEGHHIGPSQFKQLILEPRRGGRWFERAEDGLETNWGEVLVWDRPARLLLAWRISAEWKFDPDLETTLEIHFEAIDSRSTRLRFEHRDLERLGEGGRATAESMRGGWGELLQRFAQLAALQPA